VSARPHELRPHGCRRASARTRVVSTRTQCVRMDQLPSAPLPCSLARSFPCSLVRSLPCSFPHLLVPLLVPSLRRVRADGLRPRGPKHVRADKAPSAPCPPRSLAPSLPCVRVDGLRLSRPECADAAWTLKKIK
jgi:hypothetical protein